MKPEKQRLIDELIGDESHSASTLLAGAQILRRRRQWRVARQILALMTFLAAVAWLVEQKKQRQPAHASPPEATRPAPRPVHSLTDAELLALFPNTPVGLATLPNGKKLLLFLRPADAAKYVTRL